MRKLDKEGEGLSAALRHCREMYGHTQQQHCFLYGVSVSTYLRWERFGPPKTVAHRCFVRDRIKVLKHRLANERSYARKKAKAAKNAGTNGAADQ